MNFQFSKKKKKKKEDEIPCLLITEKFLFWTFRKWKYVFLAKRLMERWYLVITWKFLFWTFPRWEIRSFLNTKIWWKGIFTDYWKILVLNFSEQRNAVLLWTKMQMEKLYLLGRFELYMIFQGLGNMAFRAVMVYIWTN